MGGGARAGRAPPLDPPLRRGVYCIKIPVEVKQLL